MGKNDSNKSFTFMTQLSAPASLRIYHFLRELKSWNSPCHFCYLVYLMLIFCVNYINETNSIV